MSQADSLHSTAATPATTPTAVAAATAISANLKRHARHAAGAFSPNTERAVKSDTAVFAAWCAEHGHAYLPASPETLVAFVDAQAQDKAPATVRRYVSSIGHLHRAAGLDDPTKAEEVKLALKRMHREKGRRQKQAAGVTLELRNRMLDHAPTTVKGLRDRALLAVAYDTMLRRSELVALLAEDLALADDGSATVLVRRTKTDQEGQGAITFLAPDTVKHLASWLEAAGITDGLMFRAVLKGGRVNGPLHPGDVARVFKGMALAARISPELVRDISGHSTRVGCAQDMAALGIELAAIMQAGRWVTPEMVGRYTERLVAKRGGAAKLAALQNRL
jgi:site-specific recombinase XerD